MIKQKTSLLFIFAVQPPKVPLFRKSTRTAKKHFPIHLLHHFSFIAFAGREEPTRVILIARCREFSGILVILRATFSATFAATLSRALFIAPLIMLTTQAVSQSSPKSLRMRHNIFLPACFLLAHFLPLEARIAGECEVVNALERVGVTRTFMSNWICLVKSESGFKTNLLMHSQGASMAYGIFQIDSFKYCAKGRNGGLCNQRCENFLDDDIRDDAACAKRIFDIDGFKVWKRWESYCKRKPLPPVSQCRRSSV